MSNEIKQAFGDEYDRVVDETTQYFRNEAAMKAAGHRVFDDEKPVGKGSFPAIVSFASLKKLMKLAGENIE